MNFSLEDFKNSIHDLYKLYPQDEDPIPREFIVHTGQDGMTLFNKAMKEELLRERRSKANKAVHKLNNESKITIEEWTNLKHMIDSPDHENLVVVESIIESYEQ